MKLVIVTAVASFQEEVLQLFKKSNIENFSESSIEGFKNAAPVVMTSSWFAGEKEGTASTLFFSFTSEEKIDTLFKHIEIFNSTLKTDNPIKAVVVPIERFM